MCAMRWPCLIDSARLPRQPWFPVVVFAERRWLRWVSVAPAALSSSPPPPSSTRLCHCLIRRPLSLASISPCSQHIAAIDKRGRRLHKGKTDDGSEQSTLWTRGAESEATCTHQTFWTNAHAPSSLTKVRCDSYHVYLGRWCQCTWGAFTLRPSLFGTSSFFFFFSLMESSLIVADNEDVGQGHD